MGELQKPAITERNSSIELIKVIAILLIVCSHVVQTLECPNTYVPFQDYVVSLQTATLDVTRLILTILRYSGAIGNTLFLVCSAWFLLDSKKANIEKIVFMISEIWVISVIILTGVFFLKGGNLPVKLIIMSFFPTTFSNNWYLTCYLLLYSIHPILNHVISSISQKNLLKVVFFLSTLYIGINYLGSFFSASDLIRFVTIYFVVAYIKKYTPKIASNVRINTITLIVGIIGNYGMILITNFLGLRIEFFSDKLLQWNNYCSPFILLIAIGALNLARHVNYVNKPINYISKLSLLIYIIHENILLRTYYRPIMWHYIYNSFGYEHILFWVFIMVGVIFSFGLIASILYTISIQRTVKGISKKLTVALIRGYEKVERVLLRIT